MMLAIDKVCFQCRIILNGSNSWVRLKGVKHGQNDKRTVAQQCNG
jgi:hypothetical protein